VLLALHAIVDGGVAGLSDAVRVVLVAWKPAAAKGS
jgi:hypothetical protein